MIDLLNEDPAKYRVTLNDTKTGLFCEYRNSEKGIPLCRITMKYNYPAILVWRASVSGELRPKYD